ncbi:MAG: phenylalanine--tRNA ligase subunit beta [bacterium]|nr:phenylalanine--tRNA ligase subunit beta [bacterium]
MKLPMLWLSDWIDCRLTPVELRDAFTALGLEVSGISDVEGESVLDLEITVNRGDALSVRGIARDISALLKLQLKEPKFDSVSLLNAPPKIRIEEQALCPRYTGRLILGVRPTESSDWMKKRLHLAGIRPVNNIVDITNYILMDIGHPMHSFDYDKLIGGEIIIRRAKKEEELLALDGRVYKLDEDILVIADKERPVAIAGMIGGQETAVTSKTKNILLEVAYFDPILIRRTSKKLGITTESSFRFERMIDLEGLVFAQDYATHLILGLCPEANVGEIADLYPFPIKERLVVLRPDRVNKVLGTSIEQEAMKETLSRLGFGVSEDLNIKIPSFRGEIEREIDLIEEIARLYGYERIGETMPVSPVTAHFNKEYQFIERILEIMVGCGPLEVINVSFVGKETLTLFGFEEKEITGLLSPLSTDKCFLSPSLIPNLLETAQFNISRSNKNLCLFEIGKCFLRKDERWSLGGIMVGGIEKNWAGEGRTYLLADIFGVIKRLFAEIVGDEPEFIQSKSGFLRHCVKVSDIGIAGMGSNEIIDHFQLPSPPFLFELDLSKLLTLSRRKRYKEISRYPGIKIDLSLLVKKGIKSGAIARVIKDTSNGLAEEIRLYDLYEGRSVPSGFSAQTYSILYQNSQRTLMMDEVEKIRDEAVKKLKEMFGVEIR